MDNRAPSPVQMKGTPFPGDGPGERGARRAPASDNGSGCRSSPATTA